MSWKELQWVGNVRRKTADDGDGFVGSVKVSTASPGGNRVDPPKAKPRTPTMFDSGPKEGANVSVERLGDDVQGPTRPNGRMSLPK